MNTNGSVKAENDKRDMHRSFYAHVMGGHLTDLSVNIKRWRESKGFSTSEANFAEKIALCHSELSEALEAHRNGVMSGPDGVPQELAGTIIRVLDLASALGIDIEDAIASEMAKNELRPHKHGKRY